MLYVPFLLGVTLAARVNLPVILLLIACTALFVSRESLLVWWRARDRGRANDHAGRLLLIYTAIALLAGAPLILVYHLYWLLPLAVVGTVLLVLNGKQATDFEDRTVASEIMAIVGLTMTAPAAYYAASGQWKAMALVLWALSAAYFASSVFYVKLRVTALHGKSEERKRRVRWQCIGYHAFLLASLAVLALTRSLPLFVLIAFAPVLTRTVWSLVKPGQKLDLKRIGLAEIAYSVVFLVFMMLTFRSIL